MSRKSKTSTNKSKRNRKGLRIRIQKDQVVASQPMPGRLPSQIKVPNQVGRRFTVRQVWGTILAVATLIGVPAALLTLLPRITVTPSDPVDPANSLSASFTIANNNFIPLRHVTAYVSVGQIVSTGHDLDPSFIPGFKNRLFLDRWQNHYLGVDEKFTITPNDIIHKDQASDADIAIAVEYHVWILPWSNEKTFRFRTERQSDGKVYWYSAPMDWGTRKGLSYP
jgi:hypothetical protein